MIKTIAEIGINHNGDIDIAKQLIMVAKSAGCDYVKFQKRNLDVCIPEAMKNTTRETPWGIMKYIDYKQKIEFERTEYDAIDSFCTDVGIKWTASPWDIDSVDFLASYNVPFIKVPSALITNKNYLEAVRLTDIPVVMSTGMSTIEIVDDALTSLGDVSCLMHCVSTYPSKADEQNLLCIKTLKEKYPNIPIGFSNHFSGITFIPVAVALGAKWVEFHVTLDRSSWGTDQSASIEPEGVHKIMKYLKNVEVALGDGNKRIMEREVPIMQKLRV